MRLVSNSVFAVVLFLLTSCGGAQKNGNRTYLGDVPGNYSEVSRDILGHLMQQSNCPYDRVNEFYTFSGRVYGGRVGGNIVPGSSGGPTVAHYAGLHQAGHILYFQQKQSEGTVSFDVTVSICNKRGSRTGLPFVTPPLSSGRADLYLAAKRHHCPYNDINQSYVQLSDGAGNHIPLNFSRIENCGGY